jgi:hypothetical protein
VKVHCVPGIEFAPLPVLKAIVIVIIMGRRCRERQRSEMSTRETLHLKHARKPQRSQDLPHGMDRCADTDRHGWRRLLCHDTVLRPTPLQSISSAAV